MATDKVENEIYHIYLQLGYILASAFVLIGSECTHWFIGVSIPFVFGVLPALILIIILKKAKSGKTQDNSSSDSDSSDYSSSDSDDRGERRLPAATLKEKRLPAATTKAALNQSEAVFSAEVIENNGILEGIMSSDIFGLEEKLKADVLCLKKKKVNYTADDKRNTNFEDDNQFVEQEIHEKETSTKEKSIVNRKKNRRKKLNNNQIKNKKGDIMEIERNAAETVAGEDETKFDKEFKKENVDQKDKEVIKNPKVKIVKKDLKVKDVKKDVKEKEDKKDTNSKRSKSPRRRKRSGPGKGSKASVKKLVNIEDPSPQEDSTDSDENEAGPSQPSADKSPFKPFVLNYDAESDSTAENSADSDKDNKTHQSKDSDNAGEDDQASENDSDDGMKEAGARDHSHNQDKKDGKD